VLPIAPERNQAVRPRHKKDKRKTNDQDKNRGWIMKTRLIVLLSATAILSGCWVGFPALWPDNPNLADTPYMRNHTNAQSNDYIPLDAPAASNGLKKLWHALPDYSFFNPCTSGPEGNLYCSSYKDPALGKCNFIALDYRTGETLWTDADSNGGTCLLDEYTFVNSPMVDAAGNIYTSDSQRVISFSSDGNVRWQTNLPQTLTALGGNGRINNTFGFNMFSTGELVSVTLGDAFAVAMDPNDGTLLSDPFNIPAEKLVSAEPFLRPAGHLEKFGGIAGADAVWNSSFADLGNENDNDISIDTHTDTLFMVSAAEGPNDLCELDPNDPGSVEDPSTPCGDGKLWALQYDPSAPGTQKFSIVFTVRFPGPGGSATTPAVSNDGQYVVFADASAGLRVVDLPDCLANFAGVPATAANNYNECEDFTVFDLPFDLLASPTVTGDNVAMVLGGEAGVIAAQIDRDINGDIVVTEKFVYGDDVDSLGNPADELPEDCGPTGCIAPEFLIRTNPASVITAFENITYFTYTTLQITGFNPEIPVQRFSIDAEITPGLIGIDTNTGDEVIRRTFDDGVGDASNFTMAADRRTLITNNFNFVTQIARDRKRPLAEQRDAGLSAWVPERTEIAMYGGYLDFSGDVFSAKGHGKTVTTPPMGGAEDPTLHGATLKIFNPTSGEKQEIFLPAENWVFTDSVGFGGYIYTDADQSEGPCTSVNFLEGRIDVACDGPGLTFTLDEANQTAMGFSISTNPSTDICAFFHGVWHATQNEQNEFHAGVSPPNFERCNIPD
jgi:hypothetical protein